MGGDGGTKREVRPREEKRIVRGRERSVRGGETIVRDEKVFYLVRN